MPVTSLATLCHVKRSNPHILNPCFTMNSNGHSHHAPSTLETPEAHLAVYGKGPVPSRGAPVLVLAGQKAGRWCRSLRLRLCTRACAWSGFRRRNRVHACAMPAVILIVLLWAVGPIRWRTPKELPEGYSQRLAKMRAEVLLAGPGLSRATDEPAIQTTKLPGHRCLKKKINRNLKRDPLGVYDDPCERDRIARHREEMGGLAVHAEPWSLHDHVCVAFDFGGILHGSSPQRLPVPWGSWGKGQGVGFKKFNARF